MTLLKFCHLILIETFLHLRTVARCPNPTSAFSLRCYGVTKNQYSKEYMLIFQYAENGDLRHYLGHHFIQLTWKRRLIILNCLANNLSAIHDAGFTHYDLHL